MDVKNFANFFNKSIILSSKFLIIQGWKWPQHPFCHTSHSHFKKRSIWKRKSIQVLLNGLLYLVIPYRKIKRTFKNAKNIQTKSQWVTKYSNIENKNNYYFKFLKSLKTYVIMCT